MPRSGINDVLSLQDPAQSWNFDLFLPTIPGSSDTRDLTFKCMTTEMPGSGFELVESTLHGATVPYPGRPIYTHTLPATFLETVDWSTRDKFMRWKDSIRSLSNNSGSQSAAYKVTGQVVVYNDIPMPTRTCNVFGLWPENVEAIALDGSASNLLSLQVTFRFTYWLDT